MVIGSKEVFDKVIKEKALVLFSADYCVDCQRFKPIFTERMKKGCSVPVYQLDTTQLLDVVQEQRIRSIPTLRYYENNKVVDTLNDYTASGLNHFIDKYSN